jgi:FAD binding domain-containing protein
MNTGIGDAVNLAWKLAAVLHGRADNRILDTYEPERIAFARRLVATTDQAFTGVTNSSMTARVLRLHVVPAVLPALLGSRRFRRVAFRTISQTAINYRGSLLSDGHAGDVHGGDRLPWVRFAEDGHDTDNFATLTSLDWQVHIYGTAADEIRALCGGRGLPLHEFAWQSGMTSAGVRRNALYLVRPDGYVALAAANQSAMELASYLDAYGLR